MRCGLTSESPGGTVAGDGDVVGVLAVWVVAPAVVQTTIQRRLRALALYVVEPDRSSARTVQIAQRRTPASAIRHTQTTQQRSSINQSISKFLQWPNGPITIAIRARFEYDSATTRYNTLRGFLCARIRDRFEHSTRISGRRVLHVD